MGEKYSSQASQNISLIPAPLPNYHLLKKCWTNDLEGFFWIFSTHIFQGCFNFSRSMSYQKNWLPPPQDTSNPLQVGIFGSGWNVSITWSMGESFPFFQRYYLILNFYFHFIVKVITQIKAWFKQKQKQKTRFGLNRDFVVLTF